MKLVYTATQQEVKIGDKIKYRHHNALPSDPFEKLIVASIQKPKHGGSTGRVVATKDGNAGYNGGFFPSVYDMEWIERDDQN